VKEALVILVLVEGHYFHEAPSAGFKHRPEKLISLIYS